MARAHSGETPTSFVSQGFIDFLVSDHEIAKELRDYVVFKVCVVVLVGVPYTTYVSNMYHGCG